MNPKSINDIVKKVIDALPDGAKSLPHDIKHNMQTALTHTLDKLNLVTREEFDAQQKVLERTREKLDTVEAILKQHLSDKK